MVASLRPQSWQQHTPVLAVLAAGVPKGVVDALLHAFEAADVHVAILVMQQAHDFGAAFPNSILDVLLGLTRHAGEGEVDVDEVLRQIAERAEIGQLPWSGRRRTA